MLNGLQEVSGQENVVNIDVSLIPKHTQEVLACATMDLIRDILAQPGGREAIERKKVELGLIEK